MRPEPVTPSAPRQVRHPLSIQVWRDATFLHWPYPPEAVRPLLPEPLDVDVCDGVTWVGLVSLRMTRVRFAGTPPVPYLSDFLETNVRIYSVDAYGRRGVVFVAMEASRLAVVLAGRATVRLPYHWATMRSRRDGARLERATTRRWPGPAGTGFAFRASIGDPIPGSALQHFLTDRWGLHRHTRRGVRYLPIAHPPWSLHAASLVDYDDGGLVAAAGLPDPPGPPTDVLYAPRMPARVGVLGRYEVTHGSSGKLGRGGVA